MTFVFKFDCYCRENSWVLRTDQWNNGGILYCTICNTEITMDITGISYSA